MPEHYDKSDIPKGATDSTIKRIAASLWKGIGLEDTDRIEKAQRSSKALGRNGDYFEDTGCYYTSDSGTDKGGNNQNWFKD